jgi:hypothetical protein
MKAEEAEADSEVLEEEEEEEEEEAAAADSEEEESEVATVTVGVDGLDEDAISLRLRQNVTGQPFTLQFNFIHFQLPWLSFSEFRVFSCTPNCLQKVMTAARQDSALLNCRARKELSIPLKRENCAASAMAGSCERWAAGGLSWVGGNWEVPMTEE